MQWYGPNRVAVNIQGSGEFDLWVISAIRADRQTRLNGKSQSSLGLGLPCFLSPALMGKIVAKHHQHFANCSHE